MTPPPSPSEEGQAASLATTPVLGGYHPDPSVCRVGDDFWLAVSSFEYAPGVPILHSRDLIAWNQVGNALDRPQQFPPGERTASRGIFAPTLRHHDGRFWLITTDVHDDGPHGHLLVTAEDPAGPWSDAVDVPLEGIDPDIAWDDEGRCYITWCVSDDGPVRIEQARIDPSTGQPLESPRRLWSGTGLLHPEAPHLYRCGEHWYLMIAEGGTERGHTVAIARGPSVEGPFEGAPDNPLLTHRSTSHAVQNTGHADLVERADGSWAMLYLGARPRGMSPGYHVNGRETFLAAIDWVSGWPVVDVDRLHGSPAPTAFEDRFEGPLHPRWVSPGAAPREFTAPRADGGLVLVPDAARNGSPSMLGMRPMDPYWRVEVDLLRSDGRVDLLVRLDDLHLARLRIEDGQAVPELRIGPLQGPIGGTAHDLAGPVTALVRAVPSGSGGPDDLELGVVEDGADRWLARFDGRHLSTEVAGGFTGRVVGISAQRGEQCLLRFAYVGTQE